MNPTNLVLTKLAATCDRLAKTGCLIPANSNLARELCYERVFLIDKLNDPSLDEDQKRHIEARAEALAAEMVDFLDGQVFPPVQGNVVLGQNDNPDLDFRPVPIPGEPLSTTILRERR